MGLGCLTLTSEVRMQHAPASTLHSAPSARSGESFSASISASARLLPSERTLPSRSWVSAVDLVAPAAAAAAMVLSASSMAEPAPSCIASEIMPASCSDDASPAGREEARSACSLKILASPKSVTAMSHESGCVSSKG